MKMLNHQTQALVDQATQEIWDEAIFSHDQITCLRAMIQKLAKAIDKECQCVAAGKVSIDMR